MMLFPELGWIFIIDYWDNQRGSGSVIEKITALAIAIENALPLVGREGWDESRKAGVETIEGYFFCRKWMT